MRREPADDARARRPRSPMGSLATLFVACAIGVPSACPPARADAVAAATGAAREDRLGEARLFFTAGERDAADGARGTGRASAKSDVSDGAVESATTPVRASAVPSVVFQARTRVGKHVRAIVDDRPCRGVMAISDLGASLHCQALPDGVRTLALDADGRRLVVTLVDGRRKWLNVGEAALP